MQGKIKHSRVPHTSNVRLVPFLPIPVEIVRYILEISAQDDKQTSLVLSQVSKATRTWITPILYHTVTLSRWSQITSFHYTLHQAVGNTGPHVHRLFVDGHFANSRIVAEVISPCIKLDILVMKRVDHAGVIFGPSCPGPRQVLLFDFLNGYGLAHQLLQNVTHLHVDHMPENFYDIVQSLPCLTHLGLAFWGDLAPPSYLERVIRILSWPTLAMVLLHAFDSVGNPAERLVGMSWRTLANIEDDRLLVGRGLHRNYHVGLMDMKGSVWDDAETRLGHWRTLVKDREDWDS